MKIVTKILGLLNALWAFIYLVIGIVIIFLIAYLMSHPILNGVFGDQTGILVGNDSAFALSHVYWFDRFFPKIPIWYPLQGMGVSLLYSYPMGTTFLIIFLERITHLSPVELYRIISFLTFPATAIGIYFLVWTRLKSQTIGLIASVFFLLSQASWLFQTLHGIFAQSFSVVWFAPTLLTFDLYIERLIYKKGTTFSGRLFLLLTSFGVGVVFLNHVVAGTLMVVSILIWGLIRMIFGGEKHDLATIIVNSIKGVFVSAIPILLGMALAAFWLVPFSSYTGLANREGLNTMGTDQLREVSLKIPSLIGVGGLGRDDYRYDFFFFAMPVVIFFFIGIFTSLYGRKNQVRSSVVVALVSIAISVIPIYLPFIAKLGEYFFTAVYFRGLIPALVLVPIVAAWGVWSLPWTLTLPFQKNTKARPVLILFCSLVSLLISVSFILLIRHQPPVNEAFKGSYKYSFQPYGPSLTDNFDKFLKDPFNPSEWWTPVKVSKLGMEGKTGLNEKVDKYLNVNQKTDIVDVSPFAAGGAIMQGVGLVSDTKYINLYHYYASLIHGMWGYQAGVFYGKEPLYKSVSLLSELTKWYGVKATILSPNDDPVDKYTSAGWSKADSFNSQIKSNDPLLAMEYPGAEGLYSLTQKSAVLAIGDDLKGSYDHVFRSANLGALPYDSVLVVKGSRNIDDYSLADMQQFSGLVLHGYSYTNSTQAWSRIKSYLESGGVVYVDTGWQFVSRDWGNSSDPESAHNLADVFPVSSTRWGNIGNSWSGVEVDSSIDGVDLTKFDPPIWSGTPWSMALAKRSDLAPNAVPILWKGDQILMAQMSVGKGKIIWSGINFMTHITTKMNEGEVVLLKQLLAPMYIGTDNSKLVNPTYARTDPDNFNFTFSTSTNNSTWLIFRESFSPDWNAALSVNGKATKLQIYKAGPGFMLLRLPPLSAGARISYYYRLSFKDDVLAKTISIAAVLVLFGYLFFGAKMVFIGKSFGFDKMHNLTVNKVRGLTSLGKDDDY